jgi:hypothetical protein
LLFVVVCCCCCLLELLDEAGTALSCYEQPCYVMLAGGRLCGMGYIPSQIQGCARVVPV